MKEKGLLKGFWENPEEYLCSAVLLIMTLVTSMSVLSRKISWLNTLLTQELVTTMFVWVRCPVATSVFKTDFHMGSNYLIDKSQGATRRTYRMRRFLLCTANHGIWTIWGIQTVHRQYCYNLLIGVLGMPQQTIGIAIPLSAVCSIIRTVQYEIRLAKEGE